MTKTYDMLNMGRSSIDLYSNDIGSPFVNINSFRPGIWGSPFSGTQIRFDDLAVVPQP